MVDESQQRTGGLAPSANARLASDEEESLIDLVSLLRSLSNGRRTICVITLVIFAIATASAFLIPPRYTSRASFIPPSTNNSSSTAVLMGQLSQFSGLGAAGLMGGIKSPGDLYVGILKSRLISSELVKRFDLRGVYRVKKESEAEKRLVSNSDFAVDIKNSIVTISVTDKNPVRAQDMANAYLDALRETNGKLALTESSQRRLFFGQQLAKEKDDMENAEVELKKSEEESGLISPVGQTATEIQIIANTRAQIAVRQVELSALRQSATEENPEVIRLGSEISALESQLSRLQIGTGKNGGGAIPTSKFPTLALDYVRKTREVKYHEALFEMLTKQYEAARIDEAREAPLLQVLDTASYPDTKSFPPRMLMMVTGLILGSLAGVGWVLLHERFATFFASLRSGKNT